MLANGFGLPTFVMILLAVVGLRTAYALPVSIQALPEERYDTGAEKTDGAATQVSFNVSASLPPADPPALHTLKDLYEGNMKFRNHESSRQMRANATKTPSFMFLGCSDNPYRPEDIFDAPLGSTISHTNIANQYKSKDSSVKAAVDYAVESSKVQHIIVLGHYGCKGVEDAITRPPTLSRLIKAWLEPIFHLYRKTRRQEIVKLRDSRLPQRGKPNGVQTPPPADDPGFKALVEENVKHSVKQLSEHGILSKAYSKRPLINGYKNITVFVHGLVFDETTGNVYNLGVSFGPPGEAIPAVPFKALAAAKNFYRDSDRPGIHHGKTWDFSAHSH
jgi:carbonic anhydrase